MDDNSLGGGNSGMSIEDPLDVSEAIVAAEERADSPLAKYAPDLAGIGEVVPVELLPDALSHTALAVKSLVSVFGWAVRKREEERRRYLADTVRDELKRVRAKLEQLDQEYRRFVQDEFWGLVTDGLQKAERTRSTSRIARIAKILANAAIEGPTRPADMTEELMRIAVELDDEDTRVLAELVRGQRDQLQPGSGIVDHESANNYWRSGNARQLQGRDGGPATRLGITDGQFQSHCAKLQSYGLILHVPPNSMKVAPGVVPYSILQKAIDFIDAVQTREEQGGATA
jgi:hypothetical protein